MKNQFLHLSYEKRTEVLLYASRFIGYVVVPCRALAGMLHKAARSLERLPESLACYTLDIMEPTKTEKE